MSSLAWCISSPGLGGASFPGAFPVPGCRSPPGAGTEDATASEHKGGRREDPQKRGFFLFARRVQNDCQRFAQAAAASLMPACSSP